MRKTKTAFIAGLLATVLLVTMALPVTAATAPTITVSGAGAVTAMPDMATVQLGVSTEDTNPTQALIRNNTAVEAVMTALRALGIADEDISTQHFSIHQRFSWTDGTSRVIGYTVSNTIIVTVYDLDLVGDVIGAGVANGANMSGGVRFGFTDASPLYLQALAIAAADARAKANTLAQALGTTVTGIVSVTETSNFHAPVAQGPMADAAMEMDMMAGPMPSGASVPVQTTELTVTARIQMVFAIAP